MNQDDDSMIHFRSLSDSHTNEINIDTHGLATEQKVGLVAAANHQDNAFRRRLMFRKHHSVPNDNSVFDKSDSEHENHAVSANHGVSGQRVMSDISEEDRTAISVGDLKEDTDHPSGDVDAMKVFTSYVAMIDSQLSSYSKRDDDMTMSNLPQVGCSTVVYVQFLCFHRLI
jgi:hypothetical protein